MANKCIDCANAYGGCPWTEIDPETGKPKFEPVPGWTAKPVRRRTGTDRRGPVMMIHTISPSVHCLSLIPDVPSRCFLLAVIRFRCYDFCRIQPREENEP